MLFLGATGAGKRDLINSLVRADMLPNAGMFFLGQSQGAGHPGKIQQVNRAHGCHDADVLGASANVVDGQQYTTGWIHIHMYASGHMLESLDISDLAVRSGLWLAPG